MANNEENDRYLEHQLPIRLVAIDLDGTLLNERSAISAANRDAIAAIRQLGVRVLLATGRSPRDARHIHSDLELETPLICNNGALILAPDGEILHRRTLTPELAHRLATAIANEGVALNIWLEGHSTSFVSMQDDWVTEWLESDHGHQIRVGFETILDEEDPLITKIFIRSATDTVQHIQALLHKTFGSQVESTTSGWDPILEVMAEGVSKASAVAILAEQFAIAPAQIMALGDNFNDVPLLTYAGLGVAMGNAHDEVKAQAAAVTATNVDDGVAQALHRYILTPAQSNGHC